MTYYCPNCIEQYEDDECDHRTEDNRFTAPFGDTSGLEGSIDIIPVCPECKEDLEEI